MKIMLSGIKRLSIAGGIGVLIGIGLVAYIRPTENGGVAILIAIPVIVCTTVGGMITALFRKKEKGGDKDADKGKDKEPPNDDSQGDDGS
jgi:hypothetical protein